MEKTNTFELKAIQDPSGKSRGRCCRYPSPDKTNQLKTTTHEPISSDCSRPCRGRTFCSRSHDDLRWLSWSPGLLVRWRLQLAINAPFGLLWLADKTYPAVHAFDMSVLAALHAEWMAPMMGIA